jgi:hypothetical protein
MQLAHTTRASRRRSRTALQIATVLPRSSRMHGCRCGRVASAPPVVRSGTVRRTHADGPTRSERFRQRAPRLRRHRIPSRTRRAQSVCARYGDVNTRGGNGASPPCGVKL